MSIYRLKVKCADAEIEVIAKHGEVLAREIDKYFESFLGVKASSLPYYREHPQPQKVEQPAQNNFSTPMQERMAQQQEAHQQPQNDDLRNLADSQLNLHDFLLSKQSSDLFAEFIISAYYVKRILNQNSFTLKFLNSKFYPATGRLVDFSVVEEAKNRSLIDSWEEDGSTKYSLNAYGEEFFVNQLR